MTYPRIAFVTNVLSHYRVPCFQYLAEMMPGRITFFFLTKEMAHRQCILYGQEPPFPSVWLKGRAWHKPPIDDLHLNDLRPVITGGYDGLILCGWFEPSFWLLWLWGKAMGKPILFWIESTAYDGPRLKSSEICKRLLLRGTQGCVVPGRRSFEYCAGLGMKKERIFLAPNSVDQAYFRKRAADLRPQREALRRELGISGIALLFVGRLVEEHKGVSTLIKAFKKIRKHTQAPLQLLIVGAGPDLPYYEDLAKKGRADGVRFLGEKNQEQLCRIYASSDIFILPSLCEPWGLVLNEAMEFGLPLVVSEPVGAGPDLVRPGINGFVFPAGREEALARKLMDLVSDEELRRRLGQASLTTVRDFSPEKWAQGMIRAISSLSLRQG